MGPLISAKFGNNMRSMNKTPDQIAEELRPFLIELYRILDASAACATQDFENRGRDTEISHWASTLRNEARNRLEEVADLGQFPCEVKELPNNGLQIVIGEYALRVRKAIRDKSGGMGLPKAEASSSLGQYYGQMSLEYIWPTDEEEVTYSQDTVNLMVLWSPDPEIRALETAIVAQPGHGSSLDWWFPMPHPATVVNAADADDFMVDDLEYELEEGEIEDESQEL